MLLYLALLNQSCVKITKITAITNIPQLLKETLTKQHTYINFKATYFQNNNSIFNWCYSDLNSGLDWEKHNNNNNNSIIIIIIIKTVTHTSSGFLSARLLFYVTEFVWTRDENVRPSCRCAHRDCPSSTPPVKSHLLIHKLPVRVLQNKTSFCCEVTLFIFLKIQRHHSNVCIMRYCGVLTVSLES